MKTELLVEELLPAEANIITESTQDGKNTYLSGIFMQADIKNRNGRVYPSTEITEAVKIAQTTIKERNGIMGELDHPQTLNINLDRVSHVITEMSMSGSNAIGKAKLLNTPMGNIARELVGAGVGLGVSSRGAGQVNESGGVTGFQFVTVDIVAQPSAPNAYPQTIQESLELAKNGSHVVDLAEAIRHDDSAQKYFKKEIMKWLSEGMFTKK
jgi:hypothetical protein